MEYYPLGPNQIDWMRKQAPESLLCDCMCSNCHDDPHYSSYHCKHADKGKLEALGFCKETGFMPCFSWRRGYDWGKGRTPQYYPCRKIR